MAKKLIEKHNKQEGVAKPADSEKSAHLEQENMRLTNMLQTEFSNYKVAKKDCNKLRNLNKELLAINQVLLDSNKHLRESLERLQSEAAFLRTDRSLVLQALLAEGPAAAGLDPSSELAQFLTDLAQVQRAARDVEQAAREGEAEGRTRLRPRISAQEAKEYAADLDQDVKRLPLQQLLRQKARVASERPHRDDDRRSLSFNGDPEDQESAFEAKRDNLEAEAMLDGV